MDVANKKKLRTSLGERTSVTMGELLGFEDFMVRKGVVDVYMRHVSGDEIKIVLALMRYQFDRFEPVESLSMSRLVEITGIPFIDPPLNSLIATGAVINIAGEVALNPKFRIEVKK